MIFILCVRLRKGGIEREQKILRAFTEIVSVYP